ncbi:flavin reductase family protein [Caproiciproducens galactitolivorans]|uniref:Flavoredoxin n=1 Tax=Caproiciproducens galactitolivorans TaxID=642589 RepID=A0A4Z0YBJ5_9FIRM|nr:flavin reductase [Caproiciproducens galactitolivorans]QEY34953.1 flavin reductase family protein [Caproiciproducens galactitolivorans]TGJ76340.1 flavoredoxin [Caproiciproducens galactitolivorans]
MFQETELTDLSFNPFTKIGDEWMLITAGNKEKCNTMTASWGGLGVLWNKNVSFIFLRPQRYTLEFLEKEEYYSLCFFDESQRKTLNYCGSHSGRDVDKAKETGLTTVYDGSVPYFEEARCVLICRKLYGQMMEPSCFTNPSVEQKNYPNKDYHKMFVGEIVKVLKKV